MKKTAVLLLLLAVLSACAPAAATGLPAAQPTTAATDTAAPPPTEPAPAQATAVETPAGELPADAPSIVLLDNGWTQYADPNFGLRFQMPPGWFGPEAYVSGDTLRVEIGTDVVYPYGTSPEDRITYLTDSYVIVIQYTKNNQNTAWQETVQALSGMTDGQVVDSPRSRLIRSRAVTVGRFTGFEYIATLSDTAQTEPVYSRNLILIDDQQNVLTVMGSPSSVMVGEAGWRAAYQAVDEAHADMFQQIVETIELE